VCSGLLWPPECNVLTSQYTFQVNASGQHGEENLCNFK